MTTINKNMTMTRVYDLAVDNELVAKVQRATLTTSDFGIIPEVAFRDSLPRRLMISRRPSCDQLPTVHHLANYTLPIRQRCQAKQAEHSLT